MARFVSSRVNPFLVTNVLKDICMFSPVKFLLYGALLLSTVHATAHAAADSVAVSDYKNVLLIIVDDLRADLGVYGDSQANTPHIDDLAERGIVFDRAYAHQAICAPSRASLFTGLRPKTTGIRRLDQPVSEWVPKVSTLNKTFKNAGYTTLAFGKVYHHLNDDLEGWSRQPIDHEHPMRKRREEPGQPNPVIDIVASDRALPDRLNVEQAREALVALSSSEDRFFMAVGTHKPHLPFRVPQSAWDATANRQPISPDLQQPPKGAPPWSVVALEIWNYDDLPEKPGPMSPAQTQRLRRAYAASITYVDTLIGDLLQTVSDTGLADDTLIVLWSDHGYKLGEYGAWSKHTTHEVDLKIPLIVVAPQAMPQGSRSLAIVETVDIYPTILDFAGIEHPKHLEGASFKGVVLGQSDVGKKAAYSEITRWVSGVKLRGQSVRSDRYRYTAWVSVSSGEVVSKELYDHRTELLPTLNLADNKKLAPVLDALESLRFRHWNGS